MRDRQVATFLETHPGFVTGWISSGKQNRQVTLSEILESNVSERYYLSPKACAGILRRAEKRGKVLPETLASALREACQAAHPAGAGAQGPEQTKRRRGT